MQDYADGPSRQRRFQSEAAQSTLDDIARQRALEVERLQTLHTAVREYMQALGSLAADEAVSFDKELDAFSKAAQSKTLELDANAVTAYTALAKVVFNAATEAWRQRKLADAIDEANDPLQVIVRTLHDTLTNDITPAIGDEQLVVENHFEWSSRRAKAASRDASALASELRAGVETDTGLRDGYADSLERAADGFDAVTRVVNDVKLDHVSGFEARKRAVQAYGKLLEQIAAGHQALYDGKARLEDKDLLKDMFRRANDLRKAYEKVRALR